MALPIMTQLVTVEIDLAPGGTPEGTPAELHCVLSMSNYTQTRATTGTGTKLHGLFGVSKYDLSLEKDAAIGASFELVFIGVPVLSIAT